MLIMFIQPIHAQTKANMLVKVTNLMVAINSSIATGSVLSEHIIFMR